MSLQRWFSRAKEWLTTDQLEEARQRSKKYAIRSLRFEESYKQCETDKRACETHKLACETDKLACEIAKEDAILRAANENRQSKSGLDTAQRRLRDLYELLFPENSKTESETEDITSGDEGFASAKNRVQQLVEASQQLQNCQKQQQSLEVKVQLLTANNVQAEDTIKQTKTTHESEKQGISEDYAAQLLELTMRLKECTSSAVGVKDKHDELQQEVYGMKTTLDECREMQNLQQVHDAEVRALTAKQVQVEDTIEQTKTKHEDEKQGISEHYAAQLHDLTMQLNECEHNVFAATRDAANVKNLYHQLQQEQQRLTTALTKSRDSQKKKLTESVASCTSRLTAIETKHNANTAQLRQAENSVIALTNENTRLQALLQAANLKAETATRINENLVEEAKHCADDLDAFAKTRQQHQKCRSELLECNTKLDDCSTQLVEAERILEAFAEPMRELMQWRQAVNCPPDDPCDEGIEVLTQMVNKYNLLEIELADCKEENTGLKLLLTKKQ